MLLWDKDATKVAFRPTAVVAPFNPILPNLLMLIVGFVSLVNESLADPIPAGHSAGHEVILFVLTAEVSRSSDKMTDQAPGEVDCCDNHRGHRKET